MCLCQTGTQPFIQRSHVHIHKHHLQRERLILLLHNGRQNHGLLLYFCGKAPDHVQASTVTRHLIVCICKYVEMILGHIFSGIFFYMVQKKSPIAVTRFYVLWWPKNCCTVQASGCFSFVFNILAARSDCFFDTCDSYVDAAWVIHIWQPSGTCKGADNVMQRITFPDSGDKFLDLRGHSEIKCLKFDSNDKLDLF